MIQAKRAPYAGTKVPAEQSRAEIDALLRRYGIVDRQWTELYSRNVVKLEFAVELPEHRFLRIRVTPPPFTAKRKTWDAKRGYTTVEAPNWAQSMRCLLHWLKAKLEAVEYGLKSIEDEFLSDTVIHTADGRETTVAEALRPMLESGKLDLPALTDAAPETRSDRSASPPITVTSREVIQ